jgi:hypothetical protein
MTPAMREITAAVVAGLFITAIWGSAATASADVKCDAKAGKNPAEPEFYQEQYNPSVAQPLTKYFAEYRSAVASGDVEQIGEAAGALYSEVAVKPRMFETQTLFGCYDPSVLASVQQATDALAPIYDDINSAAPNQAEVTGLVSKAKPLERTYIDALNVYASQFGGQQVPRP